MADFVARPTESFLDLRALIDSAELQKIQDEFASATGLGAITVDALGVPVTHASHFTSLCTLLRRDPKVRARCMTCDAHGGLQAAIEKRPVVYQCHAGLVDFAVPIISGDHYLGALLAGQFLLRDGSGMPDLQDLQQELGLPESSRYVFDEVGLISIDRLHEVAAAVSDLVTRTLGLGAGGNVHMGPYLGRLEPLRLHPDGPTVAPLLAGTSKALPLRPMNHQDVHDIIDPNEISDNLLSHDLVKNLDIVNRFLERILPRWSMKIPLSRLKGLEDVLIGISNSQGLDIGREISQEILRKRARRLGEMNRYECQQYLAGIVIRLHGLVETEDGQSRSITTLLGEMAKDPTRFLCVADAADWLSLSPSHFSRKFKDATGVTFINYVTNQRLEKAKSMLEHTRMPVMRIAKALGFKPENYFSRVFKKNVGVTPAEYRKNRTESEDVA